MTPNQYAAIIIVVSMVVVTAYGYFRVWREMKQVNKR